MRSRALASVLLLLLLLCGDAHAKEGRAMRNAGITLTAIGLACEVVTIVLWASWVQAINDAHSRYGEYGSVPFDMGGAAIGTSAAVPLLLGVGVPLWAVGARREKRAAITVSADGVVRF
jgi:hypothetical protein